MTTSKIISKRFEKDSSKFLDRIKIIDETWIHHYDPETNEQSKGWKQKESPHPKKYKSQESAGLPRNWQNNDGAILLFIID